MDENSLGLEYVDESYVEKMVGYEVDCADGKGSTQACQNVGDFLTVVQNEHTRASKVYSLNCDRGFGPSCFSYAKNLYHGKGVPRDERAAEGIFAKACKLGFLHGCYYQAVLRRDAAVSLEDTDPKLAKEQHAIAEELLAKNCLKKKCDKSCYLLASIYTDSTSATRDPVKALPFLKKGCDEIDHAPSCHNLAVMFRKGDGAVQKDDALFRKYALRTEELVSVRREMMLKGMGDSK